MKIAIYVASLSMLLSAAAGFAVAQDSNTEAITLDMPEQPLAGALAQLALKADIKLVYYTEVSVGLRAPAVAGRYTAAEALERILGTTGLHAEYLDARTVVIRAADARA